MKNWSDFYYRFQLKALFGKLTDFGPRQIPVILFSCHYTCRFIWRTQRDYNEGQKELLLGISYEFGSHNGGRCFTVIGVSGQIKSLQIQLNTV